MIVSRRTILAAVSNLAGLGLGKAAVAQTRKLSLSGEVLDKDSKPIASVLVRAYRGKEKIGEATTGSDGKYSIEFDNGLPIDTVRYDQTAYIPGVVDDLCGTRDQTISKTLYVRGSRLAVFAAQEALSALERIYFIDTLNKVPFALLSKEYAPVLKAMSVPPELQERFKMVARLYG